MRDMQDTPRTTGADTEHATEELGQYGEETREQAERLASDGKETLNQTASQVRERAVEAAEEAREKAAERVHTAAESVRERVAGRGGIPETAGEKVAEGMQRTATYMRQHDTGTILHDVVQYVREHPKRSIVAAVAFGYVLGRVFR